MDIWTMVAIWLLEGQLVLWSTFFIEQVHAYVWMKRHPKIATKYFNSTRAAATALVNASSVQAFGYNDLKHCVAGIWIGILCGPVVYFIRATKHFDAMTTLETQLLVEELKKEA